MYQLCSKETRERERESEERQKVRKDTDRERGNMREEHEKGDETYVCVWIKKGRKEGKKGGKETGMNMKERERE